MPTLSLALISSVSYAPLTVDTTAAHTSHFNVSALTQVSFAHVLQELLSRLFVAEVLAINLLLLVGFQLVSASLMTSAVAAKSAKTALRVRRGWRRSSSSRQA